MKAWCECCGQYVDYSQEVTQTEEMEIDGTKFKANQTFGICPICGDEVLSNTLTDSNIRKAHNAYRRALGSITTDEIQNLLSMYNIGAQPLSLLLGWGANTIERQMKHTIPSKEHARHLKELQDPRKMLALLEKHSDRISASAFKKAYAATMEHLPVPSFEKFASFFSFYQSYSELMSTVFSGFIMGKAACRTGGCNVTYINSTKPTRQNYQFAFLGRNS